MLFAPLLFSNYLTGLDRIWKHYFMYCHKFPCNIVSRILLLRSTDISCPVFAVWSCGPWLRSRKCVYTHRSTCLYFLQTCLAMAWGRCFRLAQSWVCWLCTAQSVCDDKQVGLGVGLHSSHRKRAHKYSQQATHHFCRHHPAFNDHSTSSGHPSTATHSKSYYWHNTVHNTDKSTILHTLSIIKVLLWYYVSPSHFSINICK